MQRLGLPFFQPLAPRVVPLVPDLLNANVLEQLALLFFEERLVPLRSPFLRGIGATDEGELSDLTVLDVERVEVVSASEEDGLSVPREDGLRLAVFRVRQPPDRRVRPADQIEIPASRDDPPPTVRRHISAREDRGERVGRLVVDPLGRPPVRRNPIQLAVRVPLGARRKPAEVDPLPVVRPAHAHRRLPDVLGPVHDRLDGQCERMLAGRAGLEPRQVLGDEHAGHDRGEERRRDRDDGSQRGVPGRPHEASSVSMNPEFRFEPES